jgi:hypothetical protein
MAMTPADSLIALQSLASQKAITAPTESTVITDKKAVLAEIKKITNNIEPLVASSGLSIQYAIMMGLIHDAP